MEPVSDAKAQARKDYIAAKEGAAAILRRTRLGRETVGARRWRRELVRMRNAVIAHNADRPSFFGLKKAWYMPEGALANDAARAGMRHVLNGGHDRLLREAKREAEEWKARAEERSRRIADVELALQQERACAITRGDDVMARMAISKSTRRHREKALRRRQKDCRQCRLTLRDSERERVAALTHGTEMGFEQGVNATREDFRRTAAAIRQLGAGIKFTPGAVADLLEGKASG